MKNLDISFKNDKYKKARGGYSRLLDISCANCGNHLCYYQKDGPGILKRMYLDRITRPEFEVSQNKHLKKLPQLVCAKCKLHIGMPITYEKESRFAYRLFVGAVSKKIIKSH